MTIRRSTGKPRYRNAAIRMHAISSHVGQPPAKKRVIVAHSKIRQAGHHTLRFSYNVLEVITVETLGWWLLHLFPPAVVLLGARFSAGH